MVFPSLSFQVEPGLISQLSVLPVLIFSFFLSRARKIFLIGGALLVLLLVGGSLRAHAFMAYPNQSFGNFGTFPFPISPYQNALNFYGTPWGQVPPFYPYPSLPPYMGIMQNQYFMPHGPSPYGPGNYCPTCNPPLNPFQQPNFPIHPPHNGLFS